jgi:hypothetical protein
VFPIDTFENQIVFQRENDITEGDIEEVYCKQCSSWVYFLSHEHITLTALANLLMGLQLSILHWVNCDSDKEWIRVFLLGIQWKISFTNFETGPFEMLLAWKMWSKTVNPFYWADDLLGFYSKYKLMPDSWRQWCPGTNSHLDWLHLDCFFWEE